MKWFELGDYPSLFRGPAVLISASIPYERNGPDLTDEERKLNAHYVHTAHPERIRTAIIELCRVVFHRNWNVIFGGHPAISPLVLRAAHQFVPSRKHRKRVVVFQSGFFKDVVPDETHALGQWEHGTILWTKPKDRRSRLDEKTREELSLTMMRERMVQSRGVVAAVFIGGMEGVVEEAKLFHRYRARAKMFAIGSTGSAAADLLSHDAIYAGSVDPKLLRDSLSYSLVFSSCFEGRTLA